MDSHRAAWRAASVGIAPLRNLSHRDATPLQDERVLPGGLVGGCEGSRDSARSRGLYIGNATPPMTGRDRSDHRAESPGPALGIPKGGHHP